MARTSEASVSLKLEIGYFGLPDGRSAGSAIERLTIAFNSNLVRQAPVGGGLELSHVEISSLRAYFELGEKLLDIYEQRELLRGFVEQVIEGLRILMSANPSGVAGPIRSLIGTLAAPVAAKKASHAKIEVHGDNTQIFIIEKIVADRIVAELVPRQTRIDRKDALKALNTSPINSNNIYSHTRSATIVRVGGELYARPEGLGGVLLPIAAGSTQRIRGGSVRRGRLLYTGSIPSSFVVDEKPNKTRLTGK